MISGWAFNLIYCFGEGFGILVMGGMGFSLEQDFEDFKMDRILGWLVFV